MSSGATWWERPPCHPLNQWRVFAAAHEWYGDTAPAHLAMAKARLGAGEKPESWRQG